MSQSTTEKQPYKRKCENWLLDFGRWTLPRSEAPETFIFWTGLFSLAAALRRHVKIPKKYMGSWEVSPNLYVLFVAGAGKARKTTTSDYSLDLINEIPDITQAPDLVTKEALLTQLVKSADVSMAINAGEFGEFIAKSGPSMFGFLTNMYDGKRKIQASTLGRGVEFAEKPCVNMIGATTPEWIAENMPESVIGGGLASRIIFIFEERVRRRQMYYRNIDQEEMERLQKNLIADLTHIALNIHGEFELDPEAEAFMEDWYQKNADKYSASQHKLHGYFERLPAHIHKVAMLVHIAYSDELVIYKEDFERAIEIVRGPEKKLPRVFEGIGKNPYTVDARRMFNWIQEKGSVTLKEVRQEFYGAAEPSKLTELIESLVLAGWVEGVHDTNKNITTYSVVKKITNGKYKFDPTAVSAGDYQERRQEVNGASDQPSRLSPDQQQKQG